MAYGEYYPLSMSVYYQIIHGRYIPIISDIDNVSLDSLWFLVDEPHFTRISWMNQLGPENLAPRPEHFVSA